MDYGDQLGTSLVVPTRGADDIGTPAEGQWVVTTDDLCPNGGRAPLRTTPNRGMKWCDDALRGAPGACSIVLDRARAFIALPLSIYCSAVVYVLLCRCLCIALPSMYCSAVVYVLLCRCLCIALPLIIHLSGQRPRPRPSGPQSGRSRGRSVRAEQRSRMSWSGAHRIVRAAGQHVKAGVTF